jgi:GDPmannose 4,6-dehydratase
MGNLDAERDWGFAGDYVEAMWLMLQQDQPEDFVIGTGIAHSVRKLCEVAFSHVGLDYKDFVTQDKSLYRPAEVDQLIANPAKAGEKIGWKPKVDFEGLVRMMVDADVERLARQK